MQQPQSLSEAQTAPLRILEVGGDTLFIRAAPSQTDYYFTGHRRREETLLGPVQLLRAIRRLRRGDYDLVVMHAARFAPWHPRCFLTLLRDWHVLALTPIFATYAWRILHRFHNVPIIVIDLRDTFSVGRHNFFLLDRCHFYFKRELPADRWKVFFKTGHWDLPGRRWRSKRRNQRRMEKLRPVSLGEGANLPGETLNAAKTADVFFSGDAFLGTTPRLDGIAELRALADEGYRIDIPEQPLPHGEYLKRMSKAWLAWSPAGYGWDCCRHYEAAAVGSVAFSNYPTIVRDAPFRDGEHCLFYSPEPGALSTMVRKALADKPRLERIAAAANRHYVQHQTPRARAERITVAVLGRRLDGSAAAPSPESD